MIPLRLISLFDALLFFIHSCLYSSGGIHILSYLSRTKYIVYESRHDREQRKKEETIDFSHYLSFHPKPLFPKLLCTVMYCVLCTVHCISLSRTIISP